MGFSITLNDWIHNLCTQSVEAGIMDATSAAQIQNNIILRTGFIQAISNSHQWIKNSLFETYNILNFNNCAYFFNWYNIDDFLNSYNASNVYIGNVSANSIVSKKNLKVYGDIVFYYGTTTGGTTITKKNSILGFKYYSENTKEWGESDGGNYIEARTTGIENLRIGFITPWGDSHFAYKLNRPLFTNSINYSQVNSSIPLTKNISNLNVYAAMDPEGSYYESYFQIPDDLETGVYHAFKIFKKSQFDAMLKLFGVNYYYRKSSDIDDGNDPIRPGEGSSSSELPPGQEENQVDNEFGQGKFESDVITYPSNATMGHGVGMSTYILNSEQLKYVLSKVWDPSIIEILTNFDLSPIVNALIWPCEMYTGRTGAEITSAGVYIGKTPIPFNTLDPNTCYFITNKYLMIKDFGVIRINSKDFYGSFMDFEPYTNAYLYMPCYGIVPFPMCDILDHDVSVKCCLDISTGAGKYLVFVDNIVKYNFDAQIGVQIQLTNSNFSQSLNGIIRNSVNQIMTAPKGAGSIISDGIGNAAGSMNNLEISTVGATGNNNERLNSQECFFAFERSDFAIPKDFNKNYGRPSMITSKLGDLKGFTQCNNILIETDATEPEKQQIINLLNGGVIIK